MMTLKLNEIVTLNFFEKCIYMVSNIHFVEQYTIRLLKFHCMGCGQGQYLYLLQ